MSVSLALPLALPGWINRTSQFQDYTLINKAILEVVGVDFPMLAFARQETERKEVLFRQAVILVAAFVLAPFHAWAFFKWMGRKLADNALMRLSFRDLFSVDTLRAGIQGLATELAREGKTLKVSPDQANDALRRQLVQAKAHMLIPDLMLEGLIFANLGWIKNWFGKVLTGKKQFTGEIGAVSEQALDKLYAHQDERKTRNPGLEFFQKAIPSALAILAPVVLGVGIKKAFLAPGTPSKWMQRIKNWAHHFDYSRGILLSLGSLFIIGVLNDVGDILAARSNNERREMVLKRIPVTAAFFCGDIALMKILSVLFLKRLNIPAVVSVKKAIEQAAPELRAKAARCAAGFYWISFLLNTLLLTGLIKWNNRKTIEKVRSDAARMATMKQLAKPLRQRKPFEAFIAGGLAQSPFGRFQPEPVGMPL